MAVDIGIDLGTASVLVYARPNLCIVPVRFCFLSFPEMYLHSQLSLNIFLPLSLLYTINSDYITALVPEAAELPPPDIRFPGICEP